MNNTVLALVIAGFAMVSAMGGPVVVVWYQNRIAKEDRARTEEVAAKAAETAKADRERQEQVAEQARQAAQLLLETQEQVAAQAAEAAQLLLASNAKVAEVAATANAEMSAQLGQIHTLVNSNLTDAQRLQLAAMRALAVQSAQVIAMKQDRGVPTGDDSGAAAELNAAIDDLARNIAHKQDQTDIAEAERRRETPRKETT